MSILELTYFFMWAATSMALIEKPTLYDVLASIIVGSTWPILIPARLIRKIMD